MTNQSLQAGPQDERPGFIFRGGKAPDPQAAIDESIRAQEQENAQKKNEEAKPFPSWIDPAMIVDPRDLAFSSPEAETETAAATETETTKTDNTCLAAIAALFGRDDVLLHEYLGGLTLAARTEDGLLLNGADNQYVVSKEMVQAERPGVSPRAAFEMAILAYNSPALEDGGITLTGNLRDRYVLSLAAAHFKLNLTNPIGDNDIPDDLKAECAALRTEWEALLKNPLGEQAATVEQTADAPADPLPSSTESTPVAADDLELGNMNLDAAPQVEAGQQRLKNFLDSTAEPAADAVAEDNDKQYEEALALVAERGAISTPVLQRKLGVDYKNAAGLIDKMQKANIIGTPDNAGTHKVVAAPAPCCGV